MRQHNGSRVERAPRSLDGLIADLDGIPFNVQPERVRRRSTPSLELGPLRGAASSGQVADVWVGPRDGEELLATLAAAWRHRVPVTARGGGTGLYGEAVPLQGGIVLDLGEMQQIQEVRRGRVRAEAGARFADLDAAVRSHSQQELRLHPTTFATATIGGFVAAGLGGPGSVGWGLIGAPGNILQASVMTMEKEPQTLTLVGSDLNKIAGAWGTTGIITELELPLTTAYRWADLVVAFDTFEGALDFARGLALEGGLLKKLVSLLAAPLARHALPEGTLKADAHAVLVRVADISLVATREAVARSGGRIASEAFADEAPTPIYAHAWQHATQRALKAEAALRPLQALVLPPLAERAAGLTDLLAAGHWLHLELVRFGHGIGAVALPLIRGDEGAYLAAVEGLTAAGCRVAPHHAGAVSARDPLHAAFAAESDPQGLLNPGKVAPLPALTARD